MVYRPWVVNRRRRKSQFSAAAVFMIGLFGALSNDQDAIVNT